MPLIDARSLAAYPPPAQPGNLPRQCVTQYYALLDLAGLARSYGASSEVFLDALGDMANELDSCLSAHERNEFDGMNRMRAEHEHTNHFHAIAFK